ncbi:MAG: hypothetical protein NTW97_05685, partial [Candidatus Krumholzibacteria bacterium]|nr:hypothetical protein [Candidatus Krumholzibacteria bacterium]
ADVVLVGKLDSIPIPYEVLGKDFYAIKPDSVLNGFVGEGSVLVIEWNKASWEGSPALVQPSFSYMLFLRRIDLHSEGLPKELTAYCLVRNWKGIISLSKNASERRAVRHIQRNYGIWVDDVVQEFVEAVRFSVSNYANDEDLKEVQLSKGATKIYNALKLKQRQQENAEKGESPHP